MSDPARTVITSPAVDIIHADVEFHISNKRVVFVMVKTRDPLDIHQASAVAQCVRVQNEDDA